MRLQHPHVIQLIGRFEEGGRWGLVFPAADSDLHKFLELRSRPLADDWALGISWQLASGLAYVHGRAWAHRDLKPSNILVRFVDDVRLCTATKPNLGEN